MAFFDKLNDLAKNIGDKTNDVIETTKLNTKINSEKSAISELMRQIGELYYEKYTAGEQTLPETAELCAAIDTHNQAISAAQAEIEKLKSESIPSVAPTMASGINCPTCNTVNAPGTKFCQQCGAKLEQTLIKVCPNCGAQINNGARFCNDCGTKIE